MVDSVKKNSGPNLAVNTAVGAGIGYGSYHLAKYSAKQVIEKSKGLTKDQYVKTVVEECKSSSMPKNAIDYISKKAGKAYEAAPKFMENLKHQKFKSMGVWAGVALGLGVIGKAIANNKAKKA